MKPFDLEAAKRGEPICTRDGRKAWFIGVAPKEAGAALHQLAVWVDGEFTAYTLDGKFDRPYSEESDLDLFMAPRKHRRWLIVYRNVYRDGKIEADLCSSETDCDMTTDKLRDKGHTILSSGQRIEWME